jgi:hypothetical protein
MNGSQPAIKNVSLKIKKAPKEEPKKTQMMKKNYFDSQI